MSNVRHIIEAATPGPWMWGLSDADATFIATFDPEHVALMEAVIEAGDAPISGTEAREALDAYRKERLSSGQ